VVWSTAIAGRPSGSPPSQPKKGVVVDYPSRMRWRWCSTCSSSSARRMRLGRLGYRCFRRGSPLSPSLFSLLQPRSDRPISGVIYG
jgi:hypothetical protein